MDTVPLVIPRADEDGIDVALDVEVEGIIEPESFRIGLEITHPNLAELKVLLIAPDATAYTLLDGPMTGEGGVDLNVTMPTDRAPVTSFEDGEDRVVGKQAQGRWILRLIDTDLANGEADRILTGFTIAFTRRAGAAWRLAGDLHIEGNLYAQNSCTLLPASVDGQALPGIVEMRCGNADPVRLYAFACGNGTVDPGETCDDGNQLPGDGCDARCVAE